MENKVAGKRVENPFDSGIEGVYDAYAGIAFSLAYRILDDREAAEDVTQEAFVTAWRNRAFFDPERGSPKSWLLSVTRNKALDRLRSSRAKTSKDSAIEPEEFHLGVPDAWAEVSQALDREAIQGALVQIPEGQRRAIEMGFFEGLTHAEISGKLGLPLGTVKGRMRMGMLKMRGLLEAKGMGVPT